MIPELNFQTFQNVNDWKAFTTAIMEKVTSNIGVVLIRESITDSNDFLISLANALGKPQKIKFENFPVEDEIVYRVEVSDRDIEAGKPVYSVTSSEFSCHTDGSSHLNPFDVVFMQCVRCSEFGEESLLENVYDVISLLPSNVVSILERDNFSLSFWFSSRSYKD